MYKSYTIDGESHFRTVKRVLQSLCYKRRLGLTLRSRALGDLVPGYFNNISYHSAFIYYIPATAFSAYADPIPASGPLHLLFLPFKLYLRRAYSFSTFKAQLKCHLFKEVSPTSLGGQCHPEVHPAVTGHFALGKLLNLLVH